MKPSQVIPRNGRYVTKRYAFLLKMCVNLKNQPYICTEYDTENNTKNDTTMIAVTLTEFRKNYKEYLEKAETERVILTNKGKTYELLSQQRISDSDLYFSNPGVIAAQREAEEDERAGRVTTMTAAEAAKMLGL